MNKGNETGATNSEVTIPASNWNSTVGSLIPNDRVLVSVSPNAKLKEATTLMLSYNYSQLPVMGGSRDRDVKGVISWKTIGSSRVAKPEVNEVRHCMGTFQVVSDIDSLFDVAHIIAEHDFVLVRNQDRLIIGILTASDLTNEFRDLYEPFFLSGTVELNLRKIIQNANFTEFDIKEADSQEPSKEGAAGDIEKLTLGQFYKLIGTEENWHKLDLEKVDRKEFRKALWKVTEIRNAVMHFRAKELSDEKKSFLRSFSEFLKQLVYAQAK